jgi:hypothetical protein
MAENKVTYRYLIANIVTNQVIAEIPLTGVSYDRALKDAGSFSGTISLTPDIEGIDIYEATMPGKNAIYVLRNDECVWGGPIWSRSYDVVSKSISISANEFTSYYQHRKIWKTWNLTHSNTLVYVDPKNSSQLIVELNPDTKETITIEEGIAVELSFSDKKGYNLNGHFRVNRDFVNASRITVDKEALQWNIPNVSHTFATVGERVTVAKRQVTAGSKEVVITTNEPHLLSVGDMVNVKNLEAKVKYASYFTYKTLPTEYKLGAFDSLSIKYVVATVVSGQNMATVASTRGITVGANITQIPYTAGNLSAGVAQPKLNPEGIIPTNGFKTTVTRVVSDTVFYFSAYAAGTSINKPASKSGKVYLKIENKSSGYNANGGKREYTMQPEDNTWKGLLKIGSLIKTNGVQKYDGDGLDPFFGDLPTNNINFNDVELIQNEPIVTISSTTGVLQGHKVEQVNEVGVAQVLADDCEVAEVIGKNKIKLTKPPTYDATAKIIIKSPAYHKITGFTTARMPKSMGEWFYLKGETEYPGVPALKFNYPKIISKPSGYQYPTSNATFNIVQEEEHEYDYTRSRTADCANGDGPVIRVIDRKTFVVNADCEPAKFDNTSTNQSTATVAWDGKYQATMYTHTDTYEQVRYFLSKVHEDFVTVKANNPFLGNLEKYQIRTAKYDPATDLATITTGFRQPVHNKQIYCDYNDGNPRIVARIGLFDSYTQFDTDNDVYELIKITGSDQSINGTFYIKTIEPVNKSYVEYVLNSKEQDLIGYSLSTVSADGDFITFTTSSAHGIRAGNLVTVGGLSVTALNVDNALVVDTPTSTTIRVLSSVANGTQDTTPNSSIFTSDRLVKNTVLPINSSVATFGAHDLSVGNNFELTGLTIENYDGVWSVDSVIDDVTFTYKPSFERLNITDFKLDYTTQNGYMVTVKVHKKPNFEKYSYIAGRTKITITELDGSGYDYNGTFVLQSFEPTDETEDYYYFSYKLSGASGSRKTHPWRKVDYEIRKTGTTRTINNASYVRQLIDDDSNAKTAKSPSGKGVTTYRTTTSHLLNAGDYAVVSNIGGEFTQKTGNANTFSEYIVEVSTVPNATAFTVSNQTKASNRSLWQLAGLAGTKKDVGKANTSITPSGATVIFYDPSPSRPSSSYPSLKIDDLPDVTSRTELTASVTGKAFNAKTKTVYLKISKNEGFVVGQNVIVEDVDDYKNDIFDGTYKITGFEKVGNKFQLTYQSTNKSYKKNIGEFKGKEVTEYQELPTSSPGKVIVDAAVYVGSYGSFTKNSDIDLEFSTNAKSKNYQRVPSYRGHELKSVGDYLSEYSDKYIVKPNSTKVVRNVYGFEYRIDCVYDKVSGSFRRIFKFLPINYPNPPIHGEVSPPSRFGADKFVFEYPGNISSVTLEESAEEASTRFFMVGSDGGTGTSDASKSYIGVAHKELLANNWPLLDSTESDDKLDFLRDISENAYRYLNETKPPSGVFQIGVVGNLDPVVNTYQPGDWCSIIVNDKFVQDRLSSDLEPRNDVIVRKILSYSVSVPDAPAIPESVTLNLITEWDVDNRGQ